MDSATCSHGVVVNGDTAGSKLQLQSVCLHARPYSALPLQRYKRLLKHLPYAAITDRMCRFAHAYMRNHTSVRGALSVPMNAAKGSESMEDPKPRPLRLFPTLMRNQICSCTADSMQCALVCMLWDMPC